MTLSNKKNIKFILYKIYISNLKYIGGSSSSENPQ